MWSRAYQSLGRLVLLPLLAPAFARAQHDVTPVRTAASRQLREALASAQHGDAQEALIRTAAILHESPRFIPAMKLDAMLREGMGDMIAANEEYAAALRLAPNDPDLLFKVGLADLVRGDASHAVTLLTRYTGTERRDEEGFFYLAQAYHLSCDEEQALKAIRRANDLAPSSAPVAQKYGELLCTTGNNDKALPLLLKAQTINPALPRINFDLAVASYNNLDLEKTVAYATRETQLAPTNTAAVALLASAQVKLGQWQLAVPLLQQTIAVRPDDATSLLQLGHCQLELHQDENAIATLHRALHLDPTQPLAHFFLSRAYAAMGDAEQARHEAALHQRMLQEISFEVPKAQKLQEAELRTQAVKLLSAHHEDQALRFFAGANKGPSASVGTPYVAVAATYMSMNDLEAAKRALDHGLELDPRVKGAHTYLGILALQQNDLPAAAQQFIAELRIDANHPLALAELGEVRYRQGDWSEAISLFVRSKTSIPRFLYMLTDAYFQVGNRPAAEVAAESLAAYAHQQPEVLASLIDLLQRQNDTVLIQRIQHP